MMDGFGHMGFGWIFWLISILVGVWFLSTTINRNKSTGDNNTESVIDVLKKRYARGDISDDQFGQMKKKLEN